MMYSYSYFDTVGIHFLWNMRDFLLHDLILKIEFNKNWPFCVSLFKLIHLLGEGGVYINHKFRLWSKLTGKVQNYMHELKFLPCISRSTRLDRIQSKFGENPFIGFCENHFGRFKNMDFSSKRTPQQTTTSIVLQFTPKVRFNETEVT